MKSIFLSLGGNLENTQDIFYQILPEIENKIGKIQEKSSIYSSEAWGNPNQANFLNQILKIESTIDSPENLLEITQNLEKQFGRIKNQKWGPRPIDIDILFFQNQLFESKNLIIPHPLIQNRKFILLPFSEISPDFIHPKLMKSILQLLKDCKDPLEVKPFN